MKKLMTILGLTIGMIGFAQEKQQEVTINETQFNDVAMEVTVNSAEDLESTFKVEDLVDLMEISEGKSAKFKLTCRGELMSNGEYSKMSYEVEKGDLSEKEFIKIVKKLRKSAIAYYNNK